MDEAPTFYKIAPEHPGASPRYFEVAAPDSMAMVTACINSLLDNGLAFSVSYVTEEELIP